MPLPNTITRGDFPLEGEMSGEQRAYTDTTRAVMNYRLGMTSTLQVPSDLTEPEDPKP